MESFERALRLEPVRQSRTYQEYCWTLASCFMDYLLPSFNEVTYLDADIFFFSDPEQMFDEAPFQHRSIGITAHHFNDQDRERLGKNGEYNVGVVIAKNTTVGSLCISRWAEQCREWCFNRQENGKFADQGYLTEWQSLYPGNIWVLDNVGVNLGPWSVGNFKIWRDNIDGSVNVTETFATAPHLATYWPLVCYHFHEYIDAQHLTNWPLRPQDMELIYGPYVQAIGKAQEQIAGARHDIAVRREQLAHQSESV
jgi:hypothetical protein